MLKKMIKMIRVYFSPSYAMKVANNYWQNTDITHSRMTKEEFDFYYNELIKLIKPSKNTKILDYGGEMVRSLIDLKRIIIIFIIAI